MHDKHGGDIWSAARQMGVNPSQILDFSSNLNDDMVTIPEGIIGNRDLITPYPDPDTGRYKGNLSAYLGVPAENIVLGPGLTNLIYRFCHFLRGKRAVIVEPAFSEYERAATINDMEVTKIRFSQNLLKDLDDLEFDALFIASPSNPVGNLMDTEYLKDLESLAVRKGSIVFLDEAFAEFAWGYDWHINLKTAVSGRNLVVGRSLTKAVGLASLRLGYLIAPREIADVISMNMEPWAIPQDVLTFLQNFDFSQFEKLPAVTRERRDTFINDLKGKGFKLVGDPRANFILLELPENVEWQRLDSFLRSRLILVKFLQIDSGEKINMRVSVKRPEKNRILAGYLEEFMRNVEDASR